MQHIAIYVRVSTRRQETIRRLRVERKPIAAIARAVGLSRPTVYSVIGAVNDIAQADVGASR